MRVHLLTFNRRNLEGTRLAAVAVIEVVSDVLITEEREYGMTCSNIHTYIYFFIHVMNTYDTIYYYTIDITYIIRYTIYYILYMIYYVLYYIYYIHHIPKTDKIVPKYKHFQSTN